MQNEENKYIFSLRVFKEQENKRNQGRWSWKAANTAPAETEGLLLKQKGAGVQVYEAMTRTLCQESNLLGLCPGPTIIESFDFEHTVTYCGLKFS